MMSSLADSRCIGNEDEAKLTSIYKCAGVFIIGERNVCQSSSEINPPSQATCISTRYLNCLCDAAFGVGKDLLYVWRIV